MNINATSSTKTDLPNKQSTPEKEANRAQKERETVNTAYNIQINAT